jgi:hypothetical protein
MLRRLLPDLIAAGLLALGAVWAGAPRGVQGAVLAAMLFALGRAGWGAAGALLPDVGRASRLACAFCVAVALATTTATLLGHFGWLRPGAFLLTVALTALAVRWWGTRGEREAPPAPEGASAERPPLPRSALVERALLAAVLSALALLTLRAVHDHRYALPGSFGFDDLSYHLSAVATWHRYGDLRMLKFAVGDTSTAFYPIGSELVAWVLLAPFRDSDVAARWAQLPFLPAALLAVAALGRTLGLSRRGALFAAALFGALPRIVPLFALSAGNDLSTACFAVAGADALLLLGRRPAPGRAVYPGLALGLLAGTKYIGFLFCAPLLLVLAAGAAAHRREWSARKALGVLALAAGVALIAGGYTYLRNAWSTGNPVFPAPVTVAGRTLLPGWEIITLAHRRHLPEFALDVPRFLARRPDLLGGLFPWTLLPAALLAPAAVLVLPRRRPLAARLETAAVLALPLLFFLQFVYQMHDHRDVRYVLAGLAVAGVGCAWLLERLPALGGTLLRCALLVALLVALGGRLAPIRAWRDLVPFPLAPRIERYQAGKLARAGPTHSAELPAAQALEARVGAAGAEVAFVGGNRPYLFFGSRLQNGVQIVPSGPGLESRFYTWGDPARWPKPGRYRRWRANLERLGVRYVAVVLTERAANPERRWMRRRPESFRRLHADPWAELWEVRGAP